MVSLFVVIYAYVDDPKSVAEVRPEHRAFLAGLDNLVLSGPTDDGGAVLIFEAASASAVEQTLDADPFRTRGVIVHRQVKGWNPTLGRAKDRLGP